jgi:endonuclease-3
MDKQRVAICISLLEERYGIPHPEERDPVDLLVMTILSQNTSDTNSLKAFADLKLAYSDLEALLSAKVEDIADVIRAGGLANIKAARIKEVLLKIRQDAGSLSLDFLIDMTKEKAREYLLDLPGVGPKTASIVLLFAYGMPFMPVDTHVYRVSQRLGLVPEKASMEKAEQILEEIVAPKKYLSMHLNLINHGRLICRARSPNCEACALRYCCDSYLRATTLK